MLIEFFHRRFLISVLLSLFISVKVLFSINALSIDVEDDDERIVFLKSLKDFSANYKQITYTDEKQEYADGELFIKTPSKIKIRHKTKTMTLTIVSDNGVLKVIDENVGQITYVENQYNDLLKLFSKELNAAYLHYNFNNEICFAFKHQDADLDGCLDIDVKQNTINSMSLYGIIPSNEKQSDADFNKQKGQNTQKAKNNMNNKAKKVNNDKLSKSDIIKAKFMPIIRLEFSNTKVNKGIGNDIFEIKDSRIFDEDD